MTPDNYPDSFILAPVCSFLNSVKEAQETIVDYMLYYSVENKKRFIISADKKISLCIDWIC